MIYDDFLIDTPDEVNHPVIDEQKSAVITNAVEVIETKQKVRSIGDVRKAVFDTAMYYASVVRERKEDNRHWAISRFNKMLNIPVRSPYCSSFGLYCWKANGISIPGVNGLAYSWRKKSKLVWHRGLLHIDDKLWPRVQVFDAVVFTWSHVGFVAPDNREGQVATYSLNGVITIEANTTGGVKGRVQGVYYPVRRNMNYIFGIYDHFSGLYIPGL